MTLGIILVAICIFYVLVGFVYRYWLKKWPEPVDPDEPYEDYDCSVVWGLVDEIVSEAQEAASNFPPFNSAHEGFAVLLEEVDELKAEVWKNPNRNPDRDAKMRKEAIQVAAMALRFLTDVCETEIRNKP